MQWTLVILMIISFTLTPYVAFTKAYAEEQAKLDKTGTQWAPFLEWSLENPTFEGNSYDLIATVTFVHSKSGEEHTTEMFYDGKNTWKFRFTGTRPGRWTFVTSSQDKDLDGKQGTVMIKPNPGVAGFMTNFGSKWGWLGIDEAFVPQYVMYVAPPSFYQNPDRIDADIQKFLVEHGFNGFHTWVACRWFDFEKTRSNEITESSPNPDPRTFEALELLIRKVHKAGGAVHIWAWGDEQRRMTPMRWGLNGKVDQRLQRYICARLGPLPGWSMGYGWDLQEWVNEKELRVWHEYMHRHLGWFHFLGGRSPRLTQIYDGLDYSSYQQHRPDYDIYVKAIEQYPNKPTFLEDRFRVRKDVYPDKDYDFEMTRRGLWHSTMAGGAANIWGNLLNPRPDGMSHPYPNKKQILTWSRFWENWFSKKMVRDNRLTDGFCLKVPGKLMVFYKEDTESLQMDLSELSTVAEDTHPPVAVDTQKEYKEIEIHGLEALSGQVFQAPYRSDWAIAVGNPGSADTQQNTIGNRRSERSFGQIIVDPDHPQWLKRRGDGPFFMCGPGDPEGFLYRGELNSDGTRNGDQMAIINKLKSTGANCIYLMAVRSHGGDGARTHNPFVDNDPAKGINMNVLEQWETWFTEMDKNDVVVFFFFYDDSACVWDTGDVVGKKERSFIRALVDRFEHHRNLIWCVAEEYQEAFSPERVSKIAVEISAADDHDHVIAVHKLSGLDFYEFADDANIDQFAIQYNADTASTLHRGVVTAWEKAAGKYNLNMSEAANYGEGAIARKKSWACAMGGAYVMILDMDVVTTTVSDLEDCGRLVRFFEATNFNEMAPHDELRYGGTEYVLAKPGDCYIAYASDLSGNIGLKDMTAGTYTFQWFDCVTGKSVTQTNVEVHDGDGTWSKPTDIGGELAVYISR